MLLKAELQQKEEVMNERGKTGKLPCSTFCGFVLTGTTELAMKSKTSSRFHV